MQAQVKDELQELQPLDSASQKSVTDWLMHVISGKQPSPEERLRTATVEAVQPDPIFKLDPPVMPKETNGNGAAPEAWTGAFTAEDLCGAPVIPMPVVAKEAAPAEDAITADDVCWVPEERRLKPQPLIVETPHQEPMASVIDIARNITRDPAPHYERETATPILVPEEKEITAADISRQWVIDEMERASAAVAPPPEPEAAYVPQLVSSPVQEEIERPAEPIAAVAAEPVVVPEPVIAPEPVVAPESAVAPELPELVVAPEPVVASESMIVAEPEVVPEPAVAPEPVATLFENVVEVTPESAPGSAAIDMAAEPGIHAGDVDVAQAEPVPEAEPERAEAEPEAGSAHGVAAQEFEAPEVASENEPHAESVEHTEVVEPDKYAGVKVWAKGGYWEGSHPAPDGTEQPVIEGGAGEGRIGNGKTAQGKIENGLDATQPAASRGYFGSYLGPEEAEEIEKAKPEGWSQSWRTLIRLGSALPWLSRALPALEAGMGNHPGVEAGPAAAPGVGSEVQQDVAGMRLVQYEIRTTVQDHSAQLKRMEEQLTRVRDSVEAKAATRELAEDVQSAMKMLKIVGIGLGGLLVILIVLALVMVMKH